MRKIYINPKNTLFRSWYIKISA